MTDLDVKDRKILIALETNCREHALGKRLGMSADMVQYRINRLQQRGIIKFFLGYVDFAKLGYVDYGLYLSMQRMDPAAEQSFVKYIIEHDHVEYFSRVGGSYEFIVGFLARDPVEFSQHIDDLNTRFGMYILRRDLVTRIHAAHFPKKYLHPTRQLQESVRFGGKIVQDSVDELDAQILSLLARDARRTIVDIAATIDVPHSTVLLRIKRLEQRGIIAGYFAWIEPQHYGFQNYNLLCKFKNASLAEEHALLALSRQHKNIVWLIKTIGLWDYELGVDVESAPQLQTIIAELKVQLPTLERIDFVTVFETLKYNQYPFSQKIKSPGQNRRRIGA